MQFRFLPLILSIGSFTHAWLPGEQLEGVNLHAFSSDDDVHNLEASRHFQAKGKRWLPTSNKLRGVNLGSLFVFEPWMAMAQWTSMGCSGTRSESECVAKLGQQQADIVFKNHWNTWITQADLDTMRSYKLNTIRIPIGYWIAESLKSSTDNFPNGGLSYLDRIVGWASDRGFYIIIDLHGAPGAQVPNQPFTGQYVSREGFYDSTQYERTYKFLEWMTERIHNNNAYRNVGMFQVLNEPKGGFSSLISEFYPTAYSRIRAKEKSMTNLSKSRYLHIQFMDENWHSEDPMQSFTSLENIVQDAHRYPKYDPSIPTTQAGYLGASCAAAAVASVGSMGVIVGEWSLSVADSVEMSAAFTPATAKNKTFYRKWWAAQALAYEKQMGWVFWSWKTQLGEDYRWSYAQAVAAGVIPKDAGTAASIKPC